MSNILIATLLSGSVLILSAFAFFSAFRYMDRKDELPERIFFISLGVFAFIVAVIIFLGATGIIE